MRNGVLQRLLSTYICGKGEFLVISMVTNVHRVFNEVFLLMEQNLCVLVSLWLSISGLDELHIEVILFKNGSETTLLF